MLFTGHDIESMHLVKVTTHKSQYLWKKLVNTKLFNYYNSHVITNTNIQTVLSIIFEMLKWQDRLNHCKPVKNTQNNKLLLIQIKDMIIKLCHHFNKNVIISLIYESY